MKTSQDPRHKKRIDKMKCLFSHSFDTKQAPEKIRPILTSLHTIDNAISASAPEWPIEKIAKIDLAILRLATYELLVEKLEPPKVIIDEAVELAKEFGNQNSSKFINGVMGTLLKKQKKQS